MSKQIINVGQSANDRSGDPLRNAFEKVNSNFTELYNAVAADVQIPLQTNNGGKYLTTNGTTLSWATVAGGANTGSVTFDGVKVIGAGTASGDGFGYSTLEIVPDNNLYATSPGGAFGTSGGQYLIIDPTSPQHVHIRAGGVIDQAAAQLILGGEKANVTVRDQDNSYTENHFVTINTADNLGTPYSWNFNNNGDLALPINGGLVFDRANTSIRVGMGFHIASGEGIDIQAIDETDPNNLLYKNWYFSPLGTLTVPSPTSTPFPLVFSSANYVPTVGKPVLTLTDTPWALNGQYAYAPDGRSALALDNIWPTVTNPGYESGDAFTFDSSVHGISGFTLTITLNDVVLAGPAGWTANVSESVPPVYQSTIESNGAIKLTSNINSLILGTDGSVTVSGAIKQGNNKLDLNENNNGNVYLTTTINDSTAMFMTPTSIQTYATESVSLQAGAGLAGLETAYNDQLTMLNDVWQSVSANAGYPWGITLPLSQNTYDELIQLPPGTIGTGEEFLIVTANSVRNAWTTWQNALGDTSVGITVGNNTWAFTPDGNLTLPRDLKFNDGASTISAVDPAQSGGVGGLSVNGKDRTYIGISGNEYGYIWDFRAFGLNDETTAKPTIKFPGNGWLQEDLSNLGIGGFDVPTQLGSQGAFTLTVKDNSTFPGPAPTYNWIFGTDGNLTLPNNGVIRVDGNNIEVGGITNFNVEATGVVNIYTNNGAYQWQFGDDGILSIPGSISSTDHLNLDAAYDNGYSVYIGNNHPTAGMLGGVVLGDARGGFVDVQTTKFIIGETVVPAHSTGAVGDIKGQVAFDSNYIYYCTANYDQLGHQVTVAADYLGRTSLNTNSFQLTKTADTLQITVGDIISDGDGGATSTVVTVSSDENYTYVGTGGVAYSATFPLTFTSTDYVPGGNIWKRVSWSADTW